MSQKNLINYFRISSVTSVAVALLLLMAITPVIASTLSISQYDSKLEQLQLDIANAESGSSASKAIALSDAKLIEMSVILEKGSSNQLSEQYVDNGVLVAQVKVALESGDESQIKDVNRLITSIRESLPTGASKGSNFDAQRSITGFMAGVAFSSAPVAPESLWDKFVDWCVKELAKIHIPHFGGPVMPTVSPVIPEVILVTILTAAVALLGYVIFQIWRNREERLARVATSDSMLAINIEEQELVATHNYVRLRQLASDSAANGDFRSAFRLTFLALLVFLDAEGAIKLNRSRTNWEYLRGLVARDELASQLRPLVRDFDRIWYGEVTATETDYVHATTVYDLVQSSILRPSDTVPTSSLLGVK